MEFATYRVLVSPNAALGTIGIAFLPLRNHGERFYAEVTIEQANTIAASLSSSVVKLETGESAL